MFFQIIAMRNTFFSTKVKNTAGRNTVEQNFTHKKGGGGQIFFRIFLEDFRFAEDDALKG